MNIQRRTLLAATVLLGSPNHLFNVTYGKKPRPTALELQAASEKRVLDLKSLSDPLTIESMELLRQGTEFFVRVRT